MSLFSYTNHCSNHAIEDMIRQYNIQKSVIRVEPFVGSRRRFDTVGGFQYFFGVDNDFTQNGYQQDVYYFADVYCIEATNDNVTPLGQISAGQLYNVSIAHYDEAGNSLAFTGFPIFKWGLLRNANWHKTTHLFQNILVQNIGNDYDVTIAIHFIGLKIQLR